MYILFCRNQYPWTVLSGTFDELDEIDGKLGLESVRVTFPFVLCTCDTFLWFVCLSLPQRIKSHSFPLFVSMFSNYISNFCDFLYSDWQGRHWANSCGKQTSQINELYGQPWFAWSRRRKWNFYHECKCEWAIGKYIVDTYSMLLKWYHVYSSLSSLSIADTPTPLNLIISTRFNHCISYYLLYACKGAGFWSGSG